MLLRAAVGTGFGLALLLWGRIDLAAIAWAVTLLITVTLQLSPRAKVAFERALGAFGRGIGTALTVVLMTLVYVLVLVPLHYLRVLARRDDLRLKDDDGPSYFEPCDSARRKARYARAMFATEVRRAPPTSISTALITGIVLLTVAEVVLRLLGFGPKAIVYTIDAHAGYYPAPNQSCERYGGLVRTNNLGMRAPDVTLAKPAGTFRIFMIGDSTLWGGSYIDQEDLYPRILSRKLNDIAGGDIEVLNMAANGWGPFHERGYIEKFGTFGADLVIVCLPFDDLEREKYTLASLPFFARSNPPRLGLEEAFMHTMWRYRHGRIQPTPERRDEQRELGILEYDRLVALLQSGKSEAPGAPAPLTEIAGAEVIFEILPSREVAFGEAARLSEEPRFALKLSQKLSKRGIAIHYPQGYLAGMGEPEELYHDQVHLSTRGHAAYADYLSDRILTSSTRFAEWTKGRGRRTP